MDVGHLSSERLVVLETETALVVAPEDDPDDWIAVFAKGPEFPALDWAERMAALFNLRAGDQFANEQSLVLEYTDCYHPDRK